MKKWKSKFSSRTGRVGAFGLCLLFHFSTFPLLPLAEAAQGAAFTPYSEAAPVFASLREDLWPAAFRGRPAAEIEAGWAQWTRERDAAIRARVAGGDADSVIHLMLFGTSFTRAPRATSRELSALAAKPAAALVALKPRIDDFIAAVLAPGTNERLLVAREVIARAGIDPAAAGGREAMRRYLEERALAVGDAGAEQLATMINEPGAMSTIFRERGLSTDTTLSVDFGLERTLEELKHSGALDTGTIRRVAIVGPGLDFIDKQNGYDFYPLQTIQPFAIIDSLLRVDLAAPGGVRVTAFDLSPRVLQHIDAARERARGMAAYTIVLPRNLERPSAPALAAYWERFGNWIGDAAKAPLPPPGAGKIDVRSVAVRAASVLAVSGQDLNVVLQRPADTDPPFDLVIATNVLLYYDVFEQSLALANIAAMLRPGGLLLTNNRLVELPASPMASIGFTDVIYMSLPGVGESGDRMMWYQKPR